MTWRTNLTNFCSFSTQYFFKQISSIMAFILNSLFTNKSTFFLRSLSHPIVSMLSVDDDSDDNDDDVAAQSLGVGGRLSSPPSLHLKLSIIVAALIKERSWCSIWPCIFICPAIAFGICPNRLFPRWTVCFLIKLIENFK